MGWKTGKEHDTKGGLRDTLGPTHTDTYHTDDRGKRDRHHSEDLKVSGAKEKPSMRDVVPPGKK